MLIFYQPGILNNTYFLDAEESRHCIKVLRKKNGDQITVVDGTGTFYRCIITSDHPKKCEFKVSSQYKEEGRGYSIHIAIAPTKSVERLEWFVEKATEIGIDQISLINCHNSERKVIKVERLIKKAVAAMKQSVKATLPKISDVIAFKDFIHSMPPDLNKFIAIVDFTNPLQLYTEGKASTKNCILIGPEGDFSTEEIQLSQQYGWQAVGLGKHRLRTETAGLVACHTLHLINYR